jgi:hypothetical protein
MGAGLECLRSRDLVSASAGAARRAFESAKLCLVAIDRLIQVKGDCACFARNVRIQRDRWVSVDNTIVSAENARMARQLGANR